MNIELLLCAVGFWAVFCYQLWRLFDRPDKIPLKLTYVFLICILVSYYFAVNCSLATFASIR